MTCGVDRAEGVGAKQASGGLKMLSGAILKALREMGDAGKREGGPALLCFFVVLNVVIVESHGAAMRINT